MFSWIPPEWVPAITSSTIATVFGFALGVIAKARIEKSIQYNFDRKIEQFKAQEARKTAGMLEEIRANSSDITAIRSGPLTQLANRSAELDKRRLEAADRLWSLVVAQPKQKMLVRMIAPLKIDLLIERAVCLDEEGQKYRDFATNLWTTLKLDDLESIESPSAERPFVSPMVWALVSAREAVVGYAAAQLAVVRTGVGADALVDSESIASLVKDALPHQASTIDKFGMNAVYQLIDELEDKLLDEIKKSLIDPRPEEIHLKQASSILNKTKEFTDLTVKYDDLPDDVFKSM